jgi:hypothetical protein
MEEIYRKITIKSEADLPKESGTYFGFQKVDEDIIEMRYDKEDALIVGLWTEYVGWYLLPVPPSTIPTDAKEILEPCITFRNRHNIKCLKYDEAIMAINYFLQSIHPQSSEREKITDNDIEVWTDKVQPVRGGYKSDYIFSAKAMRDGNIKHI